MSRNSYSVIPEVEVLQRTVPIHAAQPAPVMVYFPVSQRKSASSLVLAGSYILLFCALAALGWFLVLAQERQAAMREQIAALDAARTAEARAARQSVALLERQVAAQSSEIVLLEEGRRALANALTAQATMAARAFRRPARLGGPAQPQVSSGEPSASAATPSGQVSNAVSAPAPEPASPLQKAVFASQSLAATQTQAPPTLDSINEHIESGDPAVVNNAAEAAKYREKGMLAKIFTHPIFIDSAVLGASLMVPPSLPLTLAQSRLGRSLTKRAMKETDIDKTLAGRVAADVGNMPITRKKSKK